MTLLLPIAFFLTISRAPLSRPYVSVRNTHATCLASLLLKQRLLYARGRIPRKRGIVISKCAAGTFSRLQRRNKEVIINARILIREDKQP